MAKVVGIRQQRVQFFWDTLFKSRGDVVTANIPADHQALPERDLFVASRGTFDLSNMPTGGMFTSDQTFLTYAVRHELQFYGGVAATAGFITTGAVFMVALNSLMFRYQVSEKYEFEGPWSMTPAGGGPWGMATDSQQPIITNGEPQARSIYVLPLPVAVTKRQGIRMNERIFNYTGTVNNATLNAVTMINDYTGIRLGRAYIDGYNTRDVL